MICQTLWICVTEWLQQIFFHLNGPVVGNITRAIFDSVLKEYNAEVVISIHNLSQNYMNDCIILAQKILPKFAESNVRQRGAAYGIGAGLDHAAIYRQITDGGNINDTPTNNLEQERQCGDVDYRLKKKGSLNAVSRDIILNRTACSSQERKPRS